MHRIAGLVLLGLCAGHPALAGGPTTPPPDAPVATPVADAPSSDWTGFYIGASLGTGDVDDGEDSFDRDFYGVQAGYLRDLGSIVVGGELAYSAGDFDAGGNTIDLESTRLKLIGGYDAGRLLPYLFIGIGDATASTGVLTSSDNTTLYGLGAKFALGSSGRHMLGLEYLVETKDDFGTTSDDLENTELALRYDFRF